MPTTIEAVIKTEVREGDLTISATRNAADNQSVHLTFSNEHGVIGTLRVATHELPLMPGLLSNVRSELDAARAKILGAGAV